MSKTSFKVGDMVHYYGGSRHKVLDVHELGVLISSVTSLDKPGEWLTYAEVDEKQLMLTNPPKEKDTPKEAANELEEKVHEIFVDIRYHNEIGNKGWNKNIQSILSLIESEKVKAVEEYRQKLNKYKPKSLKEQESYGAFGTISAKEMKYLQAHIKELESKEEA